MNAFFISAVAAASAMKCLAPSHVPHDYVVNQDAWLQSYPWPAIGTTWKLGNFSVTFDVEILDGENFKLDALNSANYVLATSINKLVKESTGQYFGPSLAPSDFYEYGTVLLSDDFNSYMLIHVFNCDDRVEDVLWLLAKEGSNGYEDIKQEVSRLLGSWEVDYPEVYALWSEMKPLAA